MSQTKTLSSNHFTTVLKPWIFPLACAGLYALGLIYSPEKTIRALHGCAQIFRQLGLPMCIAITMMILLNRFLSPSVITRLLGQQSGLKGVVLSTVAGILSMGPIYAWYPLFKTLKEKGAAPFHIANFICNRSVKPVLIPILLSYFGWKLTGIFLLMTLTGALITASCVAFLCPSSHKPEKQEL